MLNPTDEIINLFSPFFPKQFVRSFAITADSIEYMSEFQRIITKLIRANKTTRSLDSTFLTRPTVLHERCSIRIRITGYFSYSSLFLSILTIDRHVLPFIFVFLRSSRILFFFHSCSPVHS